MMTRVKERQERLGLSARQLAKQLDVSPALLSLTLSGKRPMSRNLKRLVRRWLATPIAVGGEHSPSLVYSNFIAERRAHLSPRTIGFYQEKLAPFIIWCEAECLPDVRLVDRAAVARFLGFIRERRTGHGSLINGALKLHHQVAKTFFRYFGETCDVPPEWSNLLVGLKVKPSQAHTVEFSKMELNRIFDIAAHSKGKFMRNRNVAIVSVLLNSGVRASELVAMNVGDFNSDGRVKVTGKGSKDRIVSVGTTGVEKVATYLAVCAQDASALWVGLDGKRLTAVGLLAVFKRIERADSIFTDGVYPHRFRHTAITRLLRAIIPLRSVQRYAGHSNPQTTLRYAQALDADEAIAEVEGW